MRFAEFVNPDDVPTKILCRLCGKEKRGMAPFCCPERRALVARVNTPVPIRIHAECSGRGCDACSGTGVQP